MMKKIIFTLIFGFFAFLSHAQSGYQWWYPDNDGDGYGAGQPIWEDYYVSGYAPRDGDCNDTPGSGLPINPGAIEICDGIDNNCDGLIDNDVNIPSPPVPYVENGCTSSTLYKPTESGGVTYYWQSSPTGTSTSNSNSSIVRYSGSVYYIRAKSNSGSCWSDATTVSYSIVGAPTVASGSDMTACDGDNVTLHATPGGSGTTIRWYDDPLEGAVLYQGTNLALNNVNAGTSYVYWAESYYADVNGGGCAATQRKRIELIVNPSPANATGTDVTRCGSGSVTLNATGPSGSTVRWYDAATGGNYLGSGNSYVTENLTTSRTYYAETISGSCISDSRTPIEAIVLSNLNAGTINGIGAVCSNEDPGQLSNDSSASGCSGGYVYQWEYKEQGSSQWNPISSSNSVSYNPSYVSVTTTYRRKVTSGSYIGYSNEVTVTVNPAPSQPTGTGVYTICGEGTQTIVLVPGSNGDRVRWYTSSIGGNYFFEGNNYTTPVLQSDTTTSYYVTTFDSASGCESTTRRTITVNAQLEETYYLDADGDGYSADEIVACQNPDTNLYVTAESIQGFGDCDDNDSNKGLVETWYLDADGDGYYVSFVESCGSPGVGYDNSSLLSPGDCNDNSYDTSNDCGTSGSSNLGANNYVYVRTYQKSAQELFSSEAIDQTDFDFFVASDGVAQQITYFDGLGRPAQSIGLEQSPLLNNAKKDIVTYMEYDGFGRVKKEWLPFASADGSYGEPKVSPQQAALLYYDVTKYENTLNPYSEKELEDSPLNRTLKQAAPGDDWALGNGHEIEFDYLTNEDTDDVRQFAVTLNFADNTYEPTLVFLKDDQNVDIEYFSEGALYKTITYDENHSGTTKNHSTEEFKDKQGRVVLKRTYADMDLNDDGDTAEAGETEVPHDTYYVYDDYGNLTYVLPPKMDASSATLATLQGQLDELGYQYVYDHRNRLVEKRIPGKGKEYIVYNKLDQPIMTQDANQRSTGEWLYTKYDAFGRVAFTGKSEEMDNGAPSSRPYVQSLANAVSTDWVSRDSGFSMDNMTVEYNGFGYPNTSITEVLTVNYYDDYGFDPANEPTPPSTVFDASLSGNVKGLATGSKVKVLDPDAVSGQEAWITTITRYDDKGRPIYTYSENDFLGTTDIMETDIDFVGKPITVRSAHTRNSETVVTIDNFEYDHVGRLLEHTQCIGDGTLGYSCGEATVTANLVLDGATVTSSQTASNSITITPGSSGAVTLSGTLTLSVDPNATSGGGASSDEELIAYNSYDELGQLVQKKVGGIPGADYANTTGLQTVDYAYNVRGWLKSINNDAYADNDLFNFGINYNTVSHGGTPLFNGNIAETEWETTNDNTQRWYRYTYDALNRITTGIGNDGKFDLGTITNPVTYDKNGNIQKLLRMGHVVADPDIATSNDYDVMDNLTYSYTGNRLMKVDDSATEDQYGFKDDVVGATADGTDDYGHDQNGNMTSDANKGITGIAYNHLNLPTEIVTTQGNISYVYDAAGTKLQKTAGSSVTVYAGNYVYSGNTTAQTLQFFSTPEGYATPDGMGGYDYIYQYKDHLGNIRLSYVDNAGTLEIVEENNYYPFGLKHKGYNEVPMSPLGNDVAQKWKFGGKELSEELGLETYDFGARNYDPALGRWMNLDPLAEQMRRHSPYNYAFDNPVYFIDPDGMAPRNSSIVWSETPSLVEEGELDFVEYENKENPPTKFVTEGGEEIVETDDGSDEVYVISKDKEDKFIENLANNIDLKKDKDKKENDKLGERYGYNLKDHLKYVDIGLGITNYGDYGANLSEDREIYFRIGYNDTYSGESKVMTELSSYFENSASIGLGRQRGLAHKQAGRMHAYNPKLSNKFARYIIVNGSITATDKGK